MEKIDLSRLETILEKNRQDYKKMLESPKVDKELRFRLEIEYNNVIYLYKHFGGTKKYD